MNPIDRRTFTTGLCGCMLSGLAGCATTHQTGSAYDLSDTPPGYKPDIHSDEAGLWMQINKTEADMRTAANRIRDKAVNDLVHDIICRLTQDYCADLRPYVLRSPEWNAAMFPTGLTFVYTGFLLQAKNESQVAAVLGHEFGHFRRRHSLARMRDARTKDDIAAALGIGLSMVVAGADFSRLVNLGLNASKLAFSRDHEREADAIGIDLMSKAGYDPYEAGAVWRRVIDIDAASGQDDYHDPYLSTHPTHEEREETLKKLAAEKRKPAVPPPNRLHQVVAPIRASMLADQIDLGTFKRTEKLFDLLIADGLNPGEVLYYKGELYRRRNKEGDDTLALGLYHEAAEAAGAPPEALRQVGLMRWRKGDKDGAREYFRRYLGATPGAFDREIIQNYLKGA
jgi:beta-barrel assembly-enhancing protease